MNAPSDSEIEQEFARFEHMSTERAVTDRELRREIASYLSKHEYSRAPYQLSPPIVFRARKATLPSIEAAESKFNRISELGYPKDKAANFIGHGRCNRARDAVFYCANENSVPIQEVHPEVGDYVVLSQFCHKQEAQITFHAPIIGVKQILENLRKHGISHDWQRALEQDWAYKSAHNHLVKIDDLISDWFLKSVDKTNQHYYRLTSTIYKIITEDTLYGGTTLMDGLIYPSVASNANGYNIALKTGFVDDNFVFQNAALYHYECIDDENHQHFRVRKQSWRHEITDEDILNWRDVDFKGAREVLVLGTDLTPGEYPLFDPKDHMEIAKEDLRRR